MIPLLVFYLHIVAVTYAFTRRWQEEGLSEGVLAAFFMALIFFVGWSITSFIMKIIMEKEGLGPLLNRDAASLLVLTIGEIIGYSFFLRTGAPRNARTGSDQPDS
jgi:hypothetical protein